jgi:protein-S-isoprenylcysteine O-methyltransferase Ste14
VSPWRHIRAIGALPFMVAVVVPALLVGRYGAHPPSLLRALPGAALVAAGLGLFVATNRLFGRSEGTLAPWDPPRKLVVRGPYRRVRHPMITGVLCALLGEALLLGAPAVLLWAGAVAAVNAVYLPLVEEPRLIDRFGEDYRRYQREVPRFLPRLRSYTSRADGRRRSSRAD